MKKKNLFFLVLFSFLILASFAYADPEPMTTEEYAKISCDIAKNKLAEAEDRYERYDDAYGDGDTRYL
ncbi:hypothetical protein JXC34_01100 [Candidatus Woesearchaeota archaeon]|nr:hypothetical protein [Candidatus Woesearchaeota archaeon]